MKYRIRKWEYEESKYFYYSQYTKWWWLGWYESGYHTTQQEAQHTIDKWIEKGTIRPRSTYIKYP